jgi:type I restriction enzyme, S subunit
LIENLPEGWTCSQLGELAALINGDRGKNYPNRSTFVEVGIPFINAGHLENGIIQMLEMNYISEERFNLLGSGKVKPKDILYCLRGSLGKIAIVKDIQRGAIASSLVIIRPFDYSNPEYLFYFLISPLGKAEITKYDNGSAQPNLSAGNVGTYSIPLPPLNEQRRIVSTIEQLTDRSHKARAALEDVPKLIEQFRQSVLAAAFRGDLTADWRGKNPDIEPASELLERIKIDRRKRWEESSKSQYKPPQDIETDRLPKLPESWSWGSLDQLLYSLRNGLSRKPADEMPGIPILRISALRSMNLDSDDIRFYRPQDNENLESYFLDEGDLLFTRYNGNREFVGVCGRVNQISGKLLHPDKLIRGRVISDDLFDSHFLEIVCNSGISKKHIESYVKTSAGQHGISGSDLKTTPIPIPPIYEQRKIVEIVTMQLSTIKSIENIAASYFIDSQQLDRSILAKAFRGELVPQDPNDEPAAVLLDRIRAEREQTSTPKQRGKTTRKNSSKQLSIDLE